MFFNGLPICGYYFLKNKARILKRKLCNLLFTINTREGSGLSSKINDVCFDIKQRVPNGYYVD